MNYLFGLITKINHILNININFNFNLMEFNINNIIEKCDSKQKKIFSLFYRFLENKNYNNYIIENNLEFAEDIITDFLKKKNLNKFINIDKNKSFVNNCKKIIDVFEKNNIDESCDIESKYKKFLRNSRTNSENIEKIKKWWNNNDKIKIMDYVTKDSYEMVKEINNDEDEDKIYNLFNRNKQLVGEIRKWKDKKTIPEKFKFRNVVLQLNNKFEGYGLPIHKYIIYPISKMWHSLPKLEYKKYKYDKKEGIFIPTNEIFEIK